MHTPPCAHTETTTYVHICTKKHIHMPLEFPLTSIIIQITVPHLTVYVSSTFTSVVNAFQVRMYLDSDTAVIILNLNATTMDLK